MGNRNTRNQRMALVFRNENFQQRNAQQRNLQQRNASSESSSDNSSNKSDSSSETASNTTRTRTRNKDVETKKHEVNCSACLDKLDVSHGGISCNQNHHLCLETCAKDYVNTKIADGMEGVPLTCPVCKLAIKYVISIFQAKKKILQRKHSPTCHDGRTIRTIHSPCGFEKFSGKSRRL